MKSSRAIASAIVAFSALTLASSALAGVRLPDTSSWVPGAFDGSYDLAYDVANLTIQCGYSSATAGTAVNAVNFAVSLDENEQVPLEAFQPLMDARRAEIESLGLPYFRQQLMVTRSTLFFTGLNMAVNQALLRYPETLSVALREGAVSPAPLSYVFDASLDDADLGWGIDTVGAMSMVEGGFVLDPFLAYDYVYTPDSRGHAVSVGLQGAGHVGAGLGALRWQLEQLNWDDVTADIWGCGVSATAGLYLSGLEAAPEEVPEAESSDASQGARMLSAASTAQLKALVHQDAVKELKKSGARLDKAALARAAALGRALSR